MHIDYLADHEELIPLVARWSFEEWSYLHPEKPLEDITKSFSQRTNRNRLPICLVAFEDEKPVGMASLKPTDLPARRDLSPWLAGVYVLEAFRGRGIGSELVRKVECKAWGLGYEKLYLFTPDAEEFYKRMDWEVFEENEYNDYPVIVMEKNLSDHR
jgi:GNAT superfamily N-acetyltransferase